jgi:hypothetical protein
MTCELYFYRPGRTDPTPIFGYPSYFTRFITPEVSLPTVAQRLNQLITMAEATGSIELAAANVMQSS